MPNEPWKMPILEYVVLEKFKIHAKQELGPDFINGLLSNTEIVQQFDYISMNRVLYWQNAFLKGEIINTYRTEEFTHVIYTPATWWQHLKQTLNKQLKTRFFVRMSANSETFKHQFPVEATLICPHHGPLDKNQEHFRFLLPSRVFPTQETEK